MKSILAFSLAAGLAASFAATPLPALAQASIATAHDVTLSAKKKHHVVRYRAAAPEYIACTKTGCRPTPPGCYPAVGRDWNDNPSAYDVIVCPPRRYPG